MTTIKLAVRELVEFISRQGSISNEFAPTSRALEGTRLHQLIQKRQDDTYQSEVPLSITHTFSNGVILELSGRADGIINQEGAITIDEIKSTAKDLDILEANPVHLAQAKVYAYIYCKEHELETIDIRLTYIQIDSEETRFFIDTYHFETLSTFFENLIHDYERFVLILEEGKQLRDQSLSALKFPYPEYRPGQLEMAKSCFKAIRDHETLFIQAATGIGKTLSTLYPSLKAMAQSHTSKIMYLTAKTMTRQVAIDSLDNLCNQGAYIRYVLITAKEKICFNDEVKCNPEHCPFARGHYERINDALYNCIKNETHWTRDVIEKYAKEHQVCPFEFSLDLYNFADVSISDYNYAFDPKVSLKRAFSEKNDYTLLVDEAHNLVDRARNMYSAAIDFEILKKARKLYKPKKGSLYKHFKKIFDFTKDIDEKSKTETYIQKEIPDGLIEIIEDFIKSARKKLPEMAEGEMKEALLEVFFMTSDVIRISDYYNQDYVTYYENKQLKLFCLDPSHCLVPIYQNVQSTILFSATLLPIKYFYALLGGNDEHKKLYYASPFPNANKCLLVASDIHATYKRRQNSYKDIVSYLEILLQKKPGHYLIFFPSYAYLNDVATLAKNTINNTRFYLQTQTMNESERETYLQAFSQNTDENALFFCVLGGIFSEGIDLKGEQIVGVVVVSVGLPQICLERELIREHFDQEEMGYSYAYVYPGFNKVLQGAGRLIRTMEDRGVILLLDTRYQTKEYLSLFPMEWHDAKPTTLRSINAQLDNFYHISVEKDG